MEVGSKVTEEELKSKLRSKIAKGKWKQAEKDLEGQRSVQSHILIMQILQNYGCEVFSELYPCIRRLMLPTVF